MAYGFQVVYNLAYSEKNFMEDKERLYHFLGFGLYIAHHYMKPVEVFHTISNCTKMLLNAHL